MLVKNQPDVLNKICLELALQAGLVKTARRIIEKYEGIGTESVKRKQYTNPLAYEVLRKMYHYQPERVKNILYYFRNRYWTNWIFIRSRKD